MGTDLAKLAMRGMCHAQGHKLESPILPSDNPHPPFQIVFPSESSAILLGFVWFLVLSFVSFFYFGLNNYRDS